MSILKVAVTLKSGATHYVQASRNDYTDFESDFRKFLDGQCTRTKNYKSVRLNEQTFVSSEIAAYGVDDVLGS